MKTIIAICIGVALAGCVSADRSGDEDFNRYVEFCRETAMTPVGAEDPNDSMSKINLTPCGAVIFVRIAGAENFASIRLFRKGG